MRWLQDDRDRLRWKDRQKEWALTGAPRVPLAPFGPGSPCWPASPRSPTAPREPGRPLSPWEETEYCWVKSTHKHHPLCSAIRTHKLHCEDTQSWRERGSYFLPMPSSVPWGPGFSFRPLQRETNSHFEKIWLNNLNNNTEYLYSCIFHKPSLVRGMLTPTGRHGY